MEVTIERAALQNGLMLVQGIVERRNTVPILGHVLLELGDGSLRLAATDLEVGVRTEVPCQIGSKGSVTLNARKLFEVVREAEGAEVSLKTLDNDWIEVKCGRARFKMMGLDPRSFPAMPGQSEKTTGHDARKGVKADLKIGARVLAAMIDKTLFAVSPDEARYNLGGVMIESPSSGVALMVATDGHRLSMVEREIEGFAMTGNAILPRKGLSELRKLLDQGSDENEEEGARLVIDGQLASLERGKTELAMRLVEGEFPDYRGVIPKQSKHSIMVGRDALLAAIKRVAIFSNERYHGVRFGFAAGTLTVSSTSPETGEASETVDVDFNGEEMSVGFNASYLIQALGVIPVETEVVLGVSDEVSPGLLTTPADSQFTYVVMPMRL